jgi:hypothetical protein
MCVAIYPLFMAWYLAEPRDNFTFTFHESHFRIDVQIDICISVVEFRGKNPVPSSEP